jgi:hypothetical protein
MEKTKTAPRLFTTADARKMLPLVRVIVQDIVDQYREFKGRVEAYRASAGPSASPEARLKAPVRRREDIEDDIERLKDKVNTAVAELGELGVEFKDFDAGLVDFPARRGDDIVYLCWKLGEPTISHWHTLEGGYNGRRPIDEMLDA